MSADRFRYDDLQGRLRGLLITSCDQLPFYTLGLIEEMIDAGEYGVALETLSEAFTETNKVSPSHQTLSEVRRLAQDMGLDTRS